MSDDSFIREVEQELRSDRFNALWKRFAPVVIGGAVLIVAATAAWRGYEAYTEGLANESGDRFLRAIELAEAGDRDGALAALAALQDEGAGRYDLLARMRAASLLAESDPAGAVAGFRAVAGDGETPPAIADLARLRAAYLLVDHGTVDEVAQLAAPLDLPNGPLRHSAREALGLAALKAGDLPGAAASFAAILGDEGVPLGITERAGEMMALLRARGVTEAGPASAAEPGNVAPEAGETPGGTGSASDG